MPAGVGDQLARCFDQHHLRKDQQRAIDGKIIKVGEAAWATPLVTGWLTGIEFVAA
jgi:hypothetical protein